MPSDILIIFGEIGSGKTYHGKRIASQLSSPYLDGDDCLPPSLQKKIASFHLLSLKELDEYIPILAQEILTKSQGSPFLVVSQALYRKKHREQLKDLLSKEGSMVFFSYVKPPLIRHIKQLLSRPQGWRWLIYWLINKPFFQAPKKYWCGSIKD